MTLTARPPDRRRAALATVLLLAAIALPLTRMGTVTETRGIRVGAPWAMTDFFSGGYWGVRAMIDGENPYDAERFRSLYPADGAFKHYLPITLLIHLPFGLLPPRPAAVVFFAFSILLALVLARLAFRLTGIPVTTATVVIVAAAVLLSRPGHWGLLVGQRAVLLSVAAYAALLAAERSPGWAGAALSVVLLQPTYGVPLALLMLCRGHWRAVSAAFCFVLAVNLPLIALFAERAGGFERFTRIFIEGFDSWSAGLEPGPASGRFRVDAVATVGRLVAEPLSLPAKLLVTFAVLAGAGAGLVAVGRDGSRGAQDLALGIICLTIPLCIYHQAYDLIILTAPFVALLARGLPDPAPRWLGRAALALFAVPALNWVATASVLDAWQPARPVWLVVTSANAVCVTMLLMIYVGVARVYRHRVRTGSRGTEWNLATP